METIFTDRLELSPLTVTHADLVLAPLQDERIYLYISDPLPSSAAALEERFAFLQRGKNSSGSEIWCNWIAFLLHTREPIGWFQSTIHQDGSADLAYIVFPEHWRCGYGREACRGVISCLVHRFQCKTIVACMDTNNIRSMRLVEALGFTQKALIPNAAVIREQNSDEFRYELEINQWSGHK